MKRLVSLTLAMAMLLSLAACGGGGTTDSSTTDTSAAPVESTTTETASPKQSEGEERPTAEPGQPVYGGSATLYYNDFSQLFDPAMGEDYTYSVWLEYLWAPDWGLNDPDTYNFDIDIFNADTAGGQIAKEWNWVKNGDGTSDLFVTIRDDIYFQNKADVGMEEYDIFGGRNLTADDVVWSYSRIWGKGEFLGQDPFMLDADWFNRFLGIVNLDLDAPVEVLGDYELVFHLATESESRLSELMIAQVNITGREWGDLTLDQQNDWHYACGTGPYFLTDYSAGSYFKLTKNENYYDYDERYPENKLPYLDEITLTSVNDAAAAMSSFISGNLDYISMDATFSDDQSEQLINATGGDLQILDYEYGANSIGLKVNQEPFNDIRVRIAMQKAINLQEVNTVYYGYDTDLEYAALWNHALPGWSAVDDWDADLLDEYTYDPEGAKALLAEAGYPDGFTFTVIVDTMADPDLFELAKSYLAAVGINMEIEVASDMMEARQIQGNPESSTMFSMLIGNSSDAGFAYQSFATVGFAYCYYHGDTHMDELLAATRDATELDQQAASAKETDLYFAQQHWLIALSGMTKQSEYLATRIGGLENGELLSGQHLFKTFASRIWAKDA